MFSDKVSLISLTILEPTMQTRFSLSSLSSTSLFLQNFECYSLVYKSEQIFDWNNLRNWRSILPNGFRISIQNSGKYEDELGSLHRNEAKKPGEKIFELLVKFLGFFLHLILSIVLKIR